MIWSARSTQSTPIPLYPNLLHPQYPNPLLSNNHHPQPPPTLCYQTTVIVSPRYDSTQCTHQGLHYHIHSGTSHFPYTFLVVLNKCICLQGAFIASIQAQLLGNFNQDDTTTRFRTVNAFYTGGLVLDIMSALLAFLTMRWLERLTEEEQGELEGDFLDRQSEEKAGRAKRRSPFSWFYTWMGLSLFVPMPLLILGILCMIVGICTSIWHSAVVAALVTLAVVGVMPFVAGDFFIGRERNRRRNLIIRLSEMQGDW